MRVYNVIVRIAVRVAFLLALALEPIVVLGQDLPEVRHPWFEGQPDEAAVGRAKRFLRPLMGLSDDEIPSLIPTRKPFQGRRVAIPEDFIEWTPSQPKHITVGKEVILPEERWPSTEKQPCARKARLERNVFSREGLSGRDTVGHRPAG